MCLESRAAGGWNWLSCCHLPRASVPLLPRFANGSAPRWREWGAAIAMTAGISVFQERLATSRASMAAEVAGLIVLALGVRTLGGSELITHTTQPRRPE